MPSPNHDTVTTMLQCCKKPSLEKTVWSRVQIQGRTVSQKMNHQYPHLTQKNKI